MHQKFEMDLIRRLFWASLLAFIGYSSIFVLLTDKNIPDEHSTTVKNNHKRAITRLVEETTHSNQILVDIIDKNKTRLKNYENMDKADNTNSVNVKRLKLISEHLMQKEIAKIKDGDLLKNDQFAGEKGNKSYKETDKKPLDNAEKMFGKINDGIVEASQKTNKQNEPKDTQRNKEKDKNTNKQKLEPTISAKQQKQPSNSYFQPENIQVEETDRSNYFIKKNVNPSQVKQQQDLLIVPFAVPGNLDLNKAKNTIPDNSNYADDTHIWQYVHKLKRGGYTDVILIRSVVFLDLRKDLSDTPCLRFHLIYPDYLVEDPKNKLNDSRSYKCIISTSDRDHTVIASGIELIAQPAGFVKQINGVIYKNILVFMQLNQFLSKANFTNCTFIAKVHQSEVNVIPVQRANVSDKPQRDFFICVKPLYGIINDNYLPMLIEWVEFNRLLGISEIHIYNASVVFSAGVQKMMDLYVKQGIISIHQFHHPLMTKDKNGHLVEYIVNWAAMSTCYYNNIHRFKYMLCVDPDEIIMPRKHDNYTSLMNQVLSISSKKAPFNNAASVGFSWAYFYLFFKKDEKQSSFLKSMQYRSYLLPLESKYSEMWHGCIKSFTSTRFCIYVYNHHCLITDGHHTLSLMAPRSLALTHHYRSSCKKGLTDESRCYGNQTKPQADYVFKFKDDIVMRTVKTYRRLKIDT